MCLVEGTKRVRVRVMICICEVSDRFFRGYQHGDGRFFWNYLITLHSIYILPYYLAAERRGLRW